MQREDFDNWVQAYIKAWKSYELADIEALFTEDATYQTQAFQQPWVGREAIVKAWLDVEEQQGEWEFDYKWWAIEGDTGVLEGLTTYHHEGLAHSNIWIIVLNEGGRCRMYREQWVMKQLEE